MRISDWSSDVCSSDLQQRPPGGRQLLAITILFEQNLLQAALQSPDSPGHCCRIGTKCGRCSPDLSRACDGQEKTQIIPVHTPRSEEHTSELQSLMRISYAVFCLKKKIKIKQYQDTTNTSTLTDAS